MTKIIASSLSFIARALLLLAVAAPGFAIEEPPGTPKPDCPDPSVRIESDLVSEPPPERTSQPASCPLCGAWRINHSNRPSLLGEEVMITSTKIKIPLCGTFDYEVTEQLTSPIAARSKDAGAFCPSKTERWQERTIQLEVRLSGHLRQDSVADFVVHGTDIQQEFIRFSAWNMERENPCDSGSGPASLSCMLMDNAKLLKLLSLEVRDLPPSKTRSRKSLQPFSATRFADSALHQCRRREADSGGGPWPEVHAQSCLFERIYEKFREIQEWRECMTVRASKHGGQPVTTTSKSSRCLVPTED